MALEWITSMVLLIFTQTLDSAVNSCHGVIDWQSSLFVRGMALEWITSMVPLPLPQISDSAVYYSNGLMDQQFSLFVRSVHDKENF